MADDRDLGRVAFATWVYLLHAAGVTAADSAVSAACAAIATSTDATAGDRAGADLMSRIDALFGGPSTPEAAANVARALFGAAVATDLGAGDRDARTTAIRKYQFSKSLPWLARIWERVDGAVQPVWLLVEKLDGDVHAMDPNPWNDVDEDRKIPVADFQVLWELDGGTSILLR